MTNKKTYWLKAGILSLSEKLAILVFGFGSLFFLIRMLDKASFGVWVLFLTATTIVEVSRVGLIQNALIKFLTNSKGDAYRRVSTASLLLNLLVGIICAALILLISNPLAALWKSPELVGLLQIYAVSTILLTFLHQFNYTQQANLQFKGIFWSNFTKQGLFFLFVFSGFVLGWEFSLIHLAMWQVLTILAGTLVSWFFGRPFLRFSLTVEKSSISELFHYGKFVMGTNLSTMIYKSIDKMMLGTLLSAAAVAVYELAIRVTNLIEVPTHAAASVVFPQSARANVKDGKGGVKQLYEQSVGIILAIVIPCVLGVLIFTKWIVLIIAGPEYLDTVPLLRLTVLFGLFVPFGVQFGTILDSIGKPHINFYFTMFGAGLNVILNYILISRFGVFGAAYGTLSTYAITFVGMQWILHKSLGIKTLNALRYSRQFYIELLQKISFNERATLISLPRNLGARHKHS